MTQGDVVDDVMEKTLDQFVDEWRQELASSDREGGVLGKRGEREDDDCVLESVLSEKRPVVREPSPLLVLPAGRGQRAVTAPAGKRKDERDVDPSSHSLLDTLIADLVDHSRVTHIHTSLAVWPDYIHTCLCLQDDINTVPFFEVRLPREVALLVFSYLSMNDLCTCSQVDYIDDV